MAFIENIPSEAFESTNGADIGMVNTPNNSPISQTIRDEEDAEKQDKKKTLDDFLQGRSKLRKTLLKSKDKSKAQAEVRKSRLADVARGALEEMGKAPETIKNTSDDDLIKRLVGSTKGTDNKKLNAVNNYIMNGGYADNVFNYLVGNTKSVYDTYEGEEEPKGFWENTLGSTLATPIKSLAGIGDIVQKNIKYGGKSIYDINKESDFAGLGELIGQANEDEYRRYKSGQGLDEGANKYKNLGSLTYLVYKDPVGGNYAHSTTRKDYYDSYDRAKENGFDGTLEQYGNYIYGMANDIYKSTSEKVDDYLKNNWYDEDRPGAGVGKFAGEIIELATLPELKIKWLNKIPGVSKVTKTISKIPGGKATTKLTKNLAELGVEGAEFQALEDAYEGDLSDLGKYGRQMKWNMIGGGIIRGITRKMSGLSNKQQQAIANKTEKEWNEMSKITDNFSENSNQTVTPYTKLADILKSAKEKLTEKRVAKGKVLEKTESNIKYDFEQGKKYDAKDMLKTIEEGFSKLGDKEVKGQSARGPNAKYPKFFEDGKTLMSADTKNTLNTISRNENGAIIKLGDEIDKLWNDVFVTTDRELNATTSKEFFDGLKSILGEQGWSKRGKGVKVLKDTFKDIETNFNGALDEASREALKKANQEAKGVINIDQTFDEMIGRLDGTMGVQTAEKISQNSSRAAIEKLFTDVKNEVGIDLNNEIGAWVLNLSLRNPKLAQELLEKIYPSQPGAIEFISKSLLNWAKRAGASRYTQDGSQNVWSKMSEIMPSRYMSNMTEDNR